MRAARLTLAGRLKDAGHQCVAFPAFPPASRRPPPSNLTAPALNTRAFRATI
ncbi:hypothetical protein K788_0001606 (plasmid) [Paraburkholderia caribensis MBA4]|uniref:Uncharacterized protein n=1 Tax=Paraburkholderia caribensis MBA4 TaxID=1323664 RepID=A0A0N7JVS6_9BURK|nr:hypothetical protein K788_0001606 [Paraburkholderia caribensis MBA4]